MVASWPENKEKEQKVFSCACCVWLFCQYLIPKKKKKNYTKESPFISFSSEIRCSHFGSAFTNKEQKEAGSWCIKYFCNTYPPCSVSLVGAATVSFLS